MLRSSVRLPLIDARSQSNRIEHRFQRCFAGPSNLFRLYREPSAIRAAGAPRGYPLLVLRQGSCFSQANWLASARSCRKGGVALGSWLISSQSATALISKGLGRGRDIVRSWRWSPFRGALGGDAGGEVPSNGTRAAVLRQVDVQLERLRTLAARAPWPSALGNTGTRSLQSHILALFLALMVVVQVGGFALINTVGISAARKSIGEDLVAGALVFDHLLDQETQRLVQGARLMSSDYTFREVIASGDLD